MDDITEIQLASVVTLYGLVLLLPILRDLIERIKMF